MRRMFKAAALALMVVVAINGPCHAQSDPSAFPPIGRMISVDGHQVHIYCTGTGAPTVILEGGRTAGSLVWAWVQRDVSKVSRVCSYDRPGYGWSDPTDIPLDAAHTSQQLHAFLQAANEKPPYIVVGHSMGGAYARMFAGDHREELAGLVLVDATHPSMMTSGAEIGLPPIDKPQGGSLGTVLVSSGMLPLAMQLGIVKTGYDDSWAGLPPEFVPALKAFTTSPQFFETYTKETPTFADSLNQISSLDGLGNMPLTVISSDKWVDKDQETAERRAEWQKKQQRKWLSISTKSQFLIVPGADHNSLLNNKDHAGIVANAIVKMVEARRRASKTALQHVTDRNASRHHDNVPGSETGR